MLLVCIIRLYIRVQLLFLYEKSERNQNVTICRVFGKASCVFQVFSVIWTHVRIFKSKDELHVVNVLNVLPGNTDFDMDLDK